MTVRISTFCALAAATALTPIFAFPALAQGAASPNTGLEEIVVTAQKREENVQSVPISISAVSSQELQNRSVTQLSDLQSATPNVTFSGTAQGTLATTVGIRGLRSASIELTNDQPTAIYIDDIYQSSAVGSMSFLGPDVERIEVLRGPQGTLFGRNTIGGAVSIHTARPNLNDFSGRLMAGAGDYGLVEGQAMLNIPVVKGVAALRLNGGYRDDNGFTRDTTFGRRLGQNKQVYARAQLQLVPSSTVDINLSADYVKATTEGNMNQPVFLTKAHPAFVSATNPDGLSSAFRALGLYYLGRAPTLADFDNVQSQFFACGGGPVPTIAPRCWSPQPTNPVTTTGLFERAGDMARPSRYEEWGVAANVSLHLADNLELKSITSYRSFIHDSSKDYDATGSLLLWNAAFPKGKTFSEELQLNGRAFDDRAKFTLGAYHYRFNGVEDATNTQLQPLTGNNSANYLHDVIKNRSIGFFGQTTFAVTDQINITGGLRWTKDQKSISVSQYGSRAVSATTPLGYSCTLPIAPPNSNTDPSLCVNTPPTLKYTSWDWTAGIDYKPMDNLMVYFRAAKGFQAGGINQRSVTGLDFVQYLPMSAINYELGLKADLFDRHLRVNLSAFQNDVKNFQRSVASTFVFNVNGVPTSASVVAQINAATARIRGLEAEVTLIPFEGARIAAQFGHTDPKWIKFVADGPAGPKSLDLSFTDFQQISKWTWGISPSYTLPMSFGELHFQADYSWQSTQNMQPALQYPTDREIPVPGLIQKGYGLLNGRIAAKIHDNTELAVWGKNLTDERYIIGGLNLAGTAGFAFATVGNPRTFGVQVSHKF